MPRSKSPEWKSNLGKIPRCKPIDVMSVTGIECKAYVPRFNKILYPNIRAPQKRIHARRLDPKDPNTQIGDIHVVAWR